jgi:hypothetical protein
MKNNQSRKVTWLFSSLGFSQGDRKAKESSLYWRGMAEESTVEPREDDVLGVMLQVSCLYRLL